MNLYHHPTTYDASGANADAPNNGGSRADSPLLPYASERDQHIEALQCALDVCKAECETRSYGISPILGLAARSYYGAFGGAAEAIADALAVLIQERAELRGRLAAEEQAQEVAR